jgi:hypothetical protein
MADMSKKTDGPAPDSAEGYDSSLLPDFDHEFVSDADLAAFASALSAPDPSPQLRRSHTLESLSKLAGDKQE